MEKNNKKVLDISDIAFKKVFNDSRLYLPIRWDGKDYLETLQELYAHYIRKLMTPNLSDDYDSPNEVTVGRIEKICCKIRASVSKYLDGFPSQAYKTFSDAMKNLWANPLKIYCKTSNGTSEFHYKDNLNLFRVVCVSDNALHERSRVFHAPYNLRSKVSTSRYSIAGFPSLYLGTSLELCCEEINFNPYEKFALASKFKIERDSSDSKIEIRVIELAVKPQDFFRSYENNETHGRFIDSYMLSNIDVRELYLLWYPLIAACSFIRANKNDPFAAEYIIPQLLMQWVRQKMCSDDEELMGIRYFSCASERASDMGFNYVFPSSGHYEREKYPYCPILTKAFKLTKPCYLIDYENIGKCEEYLRKDTDYDYAFS